MANIKVGTHNGRFHCDEALACFMLKLLPRYKDASIVRSRENSVLDTCDIVVDVGAVYDPSKHRYDHHMRTFKETVGSVLKKPEYDSDIKLSSAGLIFCHFGHEIIREVIKRDISDDDVESIFKHVYDTFMKEIDAIDNGIPQCECVSRYKIKTDLSNRVDRLNPAWNVEDLNIDERFQQAIEMTGEEFLYHIHNTADAWLPAKRIIRNAVEKRFEYDQSGEIVVLDQFAPWTEHLYALEKEQNIEPPIKYIIWKTENYMIRAVPSSVGSFISRLPLPKAWTGLRNDDIVKASGIDGAVFVHAVGFIGAHETLDGAIAMARKSLQIQSCN